MKSKDNHALGPLGPCPGPEIECYKLQVDLYKFRAAEYRGRYEAMRNLEWKILFQGYAGYAAIAIAFTYVQGNIGHGKVVSSLAMSATVVFYLGSRYLGYRIQERLIKFNETLKNCLAELGNSLNLSDPHPSLGHQYYWTYDVQHILSTMTMWGLLAFEAAKGYFECLPAVEIGVGVLALIALVVGLCLRDRSLRRY